MIPVYSIVAVFRFQRLQRICFQHSREMAQPVAQRLMEQMRLVGEMAKELEAAGKLMSRAEKKRILDVEKDKLEALKLEQFALAAPRVPPEAEHEGGWAAVLAGAPPPRKSRSDYVDFPCSKYASHPEVFKHCTFSTFDIGREAIRRAILENTLYLDMHQTKEAMTTRMAKRIRGAGVPTNGYLDWEFDDGRGIRCNDMR